MEETYMELTMQAHLITKTIIIMATKITSITQFIMVAICTVIKGSMWVMGVEFKVLGYQEWIISQLPKRISTLRFLNIS